MALDDKGLENDWVRLAVFRPEHLNDLQASGAAEAMWAWMPTIPRGTNLRAYVEHVDILRKAGDSLPFAVYRTQDGRFAGLSGFEVINRTHRRLRIGMMWHPEEMRGGPVFPATQHLLVGRALEWGARRIDWLVPVEAVAACRAVEGLGALREGVLRSYLRMADGRWMDMVAYSMLREEAEAAHRALARRIGSAGPGGPPP